MRARVVQVVLLFVAVIAACSTTDTRATVRANTRRSLWGTGQSSPALDSASSTETTTLDQCAIQSWNPALDALLEPDRARGEVAPPRPWDHATDPRYMDRVQQRFVLSDPEMDALQRQGFVVPERLSFGPYARAYHEVFQTELPVFISVDSIFYAMHASSRPFVAHVEEHTLLPALIRVLARLHAVLPSRVNDYPRETLQDLDLYLTVARNLLLSDALPVAPVFEPPTGLEELVRAVRDGSRVSDFVLFGRLRRVDFTRFRPPPSRAGSPELERFHRGYTWLSEMEFNLVSRGCQSSCARGRVDTAETPREALDALGLSDLSGHADVADDLARLEQSLTLLWGPREDVSIEQLAQLRTAAGVGSLKVADAFPRLRTAIGGDFRRTVPTAHTPPGVDALPVIATFLGVRLSPDAGVVRALVEDRVPGRDLPRAADLAFIAGNERAREHLAGELRRFPPLTSALLEARAYSRQLRASSDLRTTWFNAIRSLGDRPTGRTASFMNSEAYLDLRINSTVAAWAALVDSHTPRPSRGYDSAGCRIPTGWVEPVPGAYAAIAAWADRALALAHALFQWSPGRADPVRAVDREYVRAFDNLSRVARALRMMAEDELEGRVLTDAQAGFLGMVAEFSQEATDAPPAYDGWYFSLFVDAQRALDDANFEATWFRSQNGTRAVHLGARSPVLGVFVVDNGGLPFVAVGPVSRAFEYTAAATATVHDRDVPTLRDMHAPWAASWLIAREPAPPLAITGLDNEEDPSRLVLLARGRASLGHVTIEFLDHHRNPIASRTRAVGTRPVRFEFPRVRLQPTSRHRRAPLRYERDAPTELRPEVVRVRRGRFWYEAPTAFGAGIEIALGGMHPIDDEGNELAEGPPAPRAGTYSDAASDSQLGRASSSSDPSR